MPLYEYECRQCGRRFEKMQKFSDEPEKTCEACGGLVERLISAPAIQFKGTGWYVTDYARKSASDPAAGNGKADQSKPEKSSDKPAKSETKTPTEPKS